MVDIQGYEGLYAVTEDGQVWSYKSKRFLQGGLDKDGYRLVLLYKDGKRTTCKVHRLIAAAFIPNPDNKPQVNHKDENKQNNCVDNLEWVTCKENINYGTHGERMGRAQGKAVYCVELDQVFYSTCEAARQTGANQGSISAVCRGKLKTTHGYH